MFSGCRSLERMDIPGSIKTVPADTLFGCAALKELSIGSGIQKKIGRRAFGGCTALESVRIPDGVTELDAMAFMGDGELVSAFIPESVKIIGAEAFARCGKLRTISLPDGIEDIGRGVFRLCGACRKKDGFVMIGYVCCGYIGDRSSITVPDKASAIAPGAFRRIRGYCS